MRGSVVKKGDRWYVKIELDREPATGRRRQKWHSGYRTKREAERARVGLLSKFDRGEYVEPTHQTLGEFLEEWLRAIEPTLRPSTFDSYSRNVRNHVIAHPGMSGSPRSTPAPPTGCTPTCWPPVGGGRHAPGVATRVRCSTGRSSCGLRA